MTEILFIGKCKFIRDILQQKYQCVKVLGFADISFEKIVCQNLVVESSQIQNSAALEAYNNICNIVIISDDDLSGERIKWLKKPIYHRQLFDLLDTRSLMTKLSSNTLDLFLSSTCTGNLFVGSDLKSSHTLKYAAVLASKLPSNSSSRASLERGLVLNESLRLLIQHHLGIYTETALTEAEISIIKYLSTSSGVMNKADVLRDVLGYKDTTATHTLEMHLCRLKAKLTNTPILDWFKVRT